MKTSVDLKSDQGCAALKPQSGVSSFFNTLRYVMKMMNGRGRPCFVLWIACLYDFYPVMYKEMNE
jgi:hypothetical protein